MLWEVKMVHITVSWQVKDSPSLLCIKLVLYLFYSTNLYIFGLLQLLLNWVDIFYTWLGSLKELRRWFFSVWLFRKNNWIFVICDYMGCFRKNTSRSLWTVGLLALLQYYLLEKAAKLFPFEHFVKKLVNHINLPDPMSRKRQAGHLTCK